MRHIIELLACGTIGAFCVWRCYAVAPLAIAEAMSLVAAYRERQQELEEIVQ